ncbi:hypothetical protein SAMN05444920_109305 [Nonomuraea solani]|uniref:Uncharacterized protein n=1 Tax=Nonomuraea solani TaxID=1144553 RepID=A0A1H6EGT8_9ACTN|nr:hypothetical protein [Nonomuraea solani]SEG96189.1 hypothetical protein SAMN05444920_109305 [Nonomuraea solani]
MIHLLNHGPTSTRGPVALTITSYVAAVALLTWATINGQLGGYLYGWILMTVLAFPASLLNLLLDGPLRHALIGQTSGDEISPWSYLIFAWPGLLMALILAWSLTTHRPHRVTSIASWSLTTVAFLAGIVITFDQWAPRRPYGWPFVLCGTGMAIGLLLTRRAEKRTGQ